MGAAAAVLSTPERSLNQRMDALARANAVRMWRAQMKRDVKAGRRSVGAMIRSTPEEMDTMKVIDLLLATPKVGPVKAMKLLANCNISPSKAIGALSDRQRRELLACSALR